MRTTTARRFLFGNWTDVVRRAMGKASPVASVESDAVKSPPDAVEPLPEAREPLPEATKPAVELPSDAVETPFYSVEETTAEKRVKSFSKKRSLAWEQAMGFLDQSSASKKEKRLGPLFILKHGCDLATGPQRYNHKNHVPEYERILLDRQYANSFAQNDRFFRKLALALYYSPHIPFQELAPYTRSLQVDLWYHLRCAAYLQRARIGHLGLVSHYDLIKVLHNTLWHWLIQNLNFSMEILLIIKRGSDHIPKDLIRHFNDYQHTWAKFVADQKEMFQSFNNILLRRTSASAHQAVFNAYYHVHRIWVPHREKLRAMISELDKEGRNSFRYVQIGHETRSSWKSMISKAIECATETNYLYRTQFIPILIRRLELMSPAELDCHTVLARRYWMRYWQRQSESEEIEKRFKEISTMTRQELKEIRQAQNKEMQKAKHARPSFTLQSSARDQNSSKVREFDDGMLKPETVQLSRGPGYSENTASTLVRKYHVGSNGDNVHPTTASENTTPQSAAPPQIYGGTLIFRFSKNSFDHSFIRRVYHERATKQAVEKSRSPREIETQNNSEILDAYKEKFRGLKHTTIEMRQNNREWNTPHGTVKHNERSDVDKMPQDRMRHSHDRGMGKPDVEPTQSRIIEILRGLEVPEACIDKDRTILKSSPSSKGPQYRKPRSSFTAEEFSHSSHSPEVLQKESVKPHDRTSADQADLMQLSNGMHGWYSPSKPVKRGERQVRFPKNFGESFNGSGSLGIHELEIEMFNSKGTASEGDDSTFICTPPHKNTTKRQSRNGVIGRSYRYSNEYPKSIHFDTTSQHNHRAAHKWRSSSEADTSYTKPPDQNAHGIDNYIRSGLKGYDVAQEYKEVAFFPKEEKPIREIRQTYKHGVYAPGSGYSTRYQGKRVSNGRSTPRFNKMRRTGPPTKGSYSWHDVNEPKPLKTSREDRVFPAETPTSTKAPSNTSIFSWFSSPKPGGD